MRHRFIKTQLDNKKSVAEGIEQIERLSKQLELLINDVLEMSRIESGKTELSHESFDLQKLVEGFLPSFRFTAEKRQELAISVRRKPIMTLEQAYKQLGGQYSIILQRLKKEERIKEYLCDFLEDEEFEQLKKALEAGDGKRAFRAVHTLKGVSMNLNLGNLEAACSELTENLRNTTINEGTKALFDQVEYEYSEVVGIIAQLLND